jgi:peptide/nickel transport system permease protein
MPETDHTLLEAEFSQQPVAISDGSVHTVPLYRRRADHIVHAVAGVARNTVANVAIAELAAVILLAIFAPVVSPQRLGYQQIDLSHVLAPPVWGGGTWARPLGTDQLGRDVFTLLAYGARTSMTVAICVVLIGSTIGTLTGLLAGYYGGWLDAVVSRLAETQLSLPLMVVGLVIVVALGPSLVTIVAVIVFVSWVSYARVVRAETLVLRETDFVALSIVAGARWYHILYRDLLPNIRSSVIVLASLNFGSAILDEAALSYLGLGIQPPQSSWGLMVNTYRIYITSDPGLVFFPAAILAVTALSANVLGDFLRERLDPRLQRIG